MNILIAGCGYVGTALGARLAADGHCVWGLRRRPEGLPDAVQPLVADLTDAAALRDLPLGLDVVYYTAGAANGSEAAYRAAYVDGPRHLLEALQQQNQQPRRVVFTSSTGVYAQRRGEWVDEDSPAEPLHAGGRYLLAGERLFLDGAFPATVLRLAGIYGPGRTRLIDSLRQGDATYQDSPPAYLNLIHRDDCVGTLRHVVTLARPASLYVGVDYRPVERGTLLRWLSGVLDTPPPRLMAKATSRRSNKRCCNARLLASGYSFIYPTFQHGYSTIIDALTKEKMPYV
jgi:nucleoside-diphosphate-sugar epimerase